MQNLVQVPKKDRLSFLQSFDRVLCDVDGVLWLKNIVIPGAPEAIESLKRLGRKVNFVSNNSLKSPAVYLEQLRSAGFQCQESDLITPLSAIISYMEAINFDKDKLVYSLSTSAFKKEFKKQGFKLVQEEEKQSPINSYDQLLEKIYVPGDNVGAVIIDFDFNFNYENLQKAVTILKNPDVLFLSGGGDATLKFEENVTLIGPKFFHMALEEVSGRKSHNLAKPSENLRDFVLKKYNIESPSRVLFIGDRITEDMGFATVCGFQKMLVLCGNTRINDVVPWATNKDNMPVYYVHSLKDLHNVITDII